MVSIALPRYTFLATDGHHDAVFLAYAPRALWRWSDEVASFMPAGKGSAYLMIEVVLLIVSALLSAGTAAAARITMLVARIAASSAKIATAGKKIKRAKAAVDALIRMLEDLSNALDDLHQLGAKLVKARQGAIKDDAESQERKHQARQEMPLVRHFLHDGSYKILVTKYLLGHRKYPLAGKEAELEPGIPLEIIWE